MDVNMPKMNGLDATQAIRKKLQKHIPIIALTANALKGDKERFLAAGMDGYIAKPIEVKELQRVLAAYAPIEEETQAIEANTVSINFKNLIKTIKARLQLDDTIIFKLLNAFTQSLKLYAKELEEAFATNDKNTVLHLAHKLKGSSSTLALDEIAKMMGKIEEDTQNNVKVRYNDIIKVINNYICLLEDGLKNEK
jgi:polar amino acid transport system substrate-binding protein